VNSLHAKSYPGVVVDWTFYDESGKFVWDRDMTTSLQPLASYIIRLLDKT
jgi:hypothetical protein